MSAGPRAPRLEGLGECLRECACGATVLSLVHLDIDDFARHVDPHGHLSACTVLYAVHRAVGDLVGPRDLRSPFGEHRVLIALPAKRVEQALEFAERVRLRLPKDRVDETFTIAVVQTGPRHFVDADRLVEAARHLVRESRVMGGGLTSCWSLDEET